MPVNDIKGGIPKHGKGPVGSTYLVATGWLIDTDGAEPSLGVWSLRDDFVFPVERHIYS